jgi:hypothetical protein
VATSSTPEVVFFVAISFGDSESRKVVHDIKDTYYSGLASKQSNVEVRQIRQGIPHFFLTRTDQHAVIIQYLSSETWGSGPTWRCPARSKLFDVAVKEFEHLWIVGTMGAKGPGAPDAER